MGVTLELGDDDGAGVGDCIVGVGLADVGLIPPAELGTLPASASKYCLFSPNKQPVRSKLRVVACAILSTELKILEFIKLILSRRILRPQT